jgi:DNA primase
MVSPVDEIKERLSVVDVISGYLKLEKTGANFRGVCPFHSEKKPSFFVSPTRQVWKCFGCGKGGDMFTFVQEIEGVEFTDGLRILAKKAGVQLKTRDPKLNTQRNRAYEICEWACKFFEKQLQEGNIGKTAKKYLTDRGLTEDSIIKWRVGFSPDKWETLLTFLKGKGYLIGEIQKAGLALQSDKGKVYDRFRGRIIFPIFDLNSQVIGFGGRAFVQKDDTAKYLNIPNTVLYNKSNILYGLNYAKVPIRKSDTCVLVEGYTDVILSSQAGVENVVATSGTALTDQQLKILKRYSNNLVTAFDMDIAGDGATKRGIDMAQAFDFDIKVAVMPQDQDPADVALESPDRWKELVDQSKTIIEFYFDSAFIDFDDQPESKKRASKILLPVIKRITNKIEQSHWVKELAKRLQVSEESIQYELDRQKTDEIKVEEHVRKEEVKNRQALIEERTVALILNCPEGTKYLEENILDYFSSKFKSILTAIKNDPKKELKDYGFDKDLFDSLNLLALQGELEDLEEGIEEEIKVCIKELKEFNIRKEMEDLTIQIKALEAKGENTDDLLGKFTNLTQQLKDNNGHNNQKEE